MYGHRNTFVFVVVYLGCVWKRKKNIWGIQRVRIREESMKKLSILWEKFIKICEWCDGYEGILIFFKDVKYKIKNLPLS